MCSPCDSFIFLFLPVTSAVIQKVIAFTKNGYIVEMMRKNTKLKPKAVSKLLEF